MLFPPISNLFKGISKMLLHLYYLYKKSHELEGIVEDLSSVYIFLEGGNLPVQCKGTHWISHKHQALQSDQLLWGVHRPSHKFG